jgi:drug/metabolite transporter (DMT)-like permease
MFASKEGEILALTAAFCWAISSISFSKAGRRVGSLPVNIIRLATAMAFLAALNAVVRHKWVPTDAGVHNWVWLSLSGFVGFFLGDLFLFRAFVMIGPRLSTLLMTLAAPVAAITGRLWIDERIGWYSLVGMAVTITGVSWVVMERPMDKDGKVIHVAPLGVLYGALGATGQGVGLVLGKIGMRPSFAGALATDSVALSRL